MSAATLEGGCLCGAVRYEISEAEAVGELVFCHCRMCRKAQGGLFGANAPIASRNFKLTLGAERIREYCSSPGKIRTFCDECGSPLYSARLDCPDFVRLRIGTLDNPDSFKPIGTYNIFYENASDLYRSDDASPRYPRFEPSRS